MHIEPFEHEHHFDLLVSWLKARKIDAEVASNLPEIGLVILKESIPLAMAFLRQAEGGVGIFEGLCTNPQVSSDYRDKAIDLLVTQIIEIAKEFEMKVILAWSLDNNTLVRSVRHGFEKTQNSIITLDLLKASTVH